MRPPGFGRSLPFVCVAVDLRALEVAEAASVIEVQVPEHDRVDVARRDTQPRQLYRQPILVVHDVGAEREPARSVVAAVQRRRSELPVVATDVVEHPTVCGLDQIREDRRLDFRPEWSEGWRAERSERWPRAAAGGGHIPRAQFLVARYRSSSTARLLATKVFEHGGYAPLLPPPRPV
jgi:hypothetical protein